MLSANPQNVALKFDCFMSIVDFDKKAELDDNGAKSGDFVPKVPFKELSLLPFQAQRKLSYCT